MKDAANSAKERARRQQAKRLASIPEQLAHPALLTDRIQPLRRPVLKLNCDAGRRTNEQDYLGVRR